MSPEESPWIQYWQPRPQAQLRLFCFPYAGGGASIYRLFSKMLPPEIEVCPVQLPGRENRLSSPPFSDISTLVAALQPALLPFFDRPYAFFGHSMGALVSFELARALRRTGQGPGPIHLFVSSHRAPQLPDPDPPVYHLPEQEFIEELRRLSGTPEEVLSHPELLQLLLPLLRADFTLCETYAYTPEEPLACPISAFGGLQDQEVPPERIRAWSVQTSGAFQVRFMEGGHFYLHEKRSSLLMVLARELLYHLQKL